MRQPLTPLTAGESPSMMEASVANEVIDHCAAFRDMQVLPAGTGKLDVRGRKATLTLNIDAAAAGGAGTITAILLKLDPDANEVSTVYGTLSFSGETVYLPAP